MNKALHIRSHSICGLAEKRVDLKVLQGRGRKQSNWAEYLHSALINI